MLISYCLKYFGNFVSKLMRTEVILKKFYCVKSISIHLIVTALKRTISFCERRYNGSLVESDYRRLFVMSVLPLCRSLYVNATYYLPGILLTAAFEFRCSTSIFGFWPLNFDDRKYLKLLLENFLWDIYRLNNYIIFNCAEIRGNRLFA